MFVSRGLRDALAVSHTVINGVLCAEFSRHYHQCNVARIKRQMLRLPYVGDLNAGIHLESGARFLAV